MMCELIDLQTAEWQEDAVKVKWKQDGNGQSNNTQHVCGHKPQNIQL